MKAKELKVRITLTEDMLGTVPKDPDIYKKFIESKKPSATEDDESETVPEGQPNETGFHTDENGHVFVLDYLFKGFMKAALKTLKKVPDTDASAITKNNRIINEYINVLPRKLYLHLPENGAVSELARPLRAQTVLGERVTLVSSDTVPAGTTIDVTIRFFEVDDLNIFVIKDILDYGAIKGLGQWRNASYGRFKYFMESFEDVETSTPWSDVAAFPMPTTGRKVNGDGTPKKRGRKKKVIESTEE